MHNLTIPIQNYKPGLGSPYTIWPGNGVGLVYSPGPTRAKHEWKPIYPTKVIISCVLPSQGHVIKWTYNNYIGVFWGCRHKTVKPPSSTLHQNWHWHWTVFAAAKDISAWVLKCKSKNIEVDLIDLLLLLWIKYREVVAQQLHDECAVLVRFFVQRVQLCDCVVKCLQWMTRI